ncbi:glycerate kinase [Paeniglutamicibacter psychrophenolicus]|uniref:Glycerate kinase n=1 Tax=Paeniglutamicibacter psychrophenolicus TaxID=257454 RepID=A0ABS4W9P6_9MICC|nr:glycerate kinase [Paeniglutamicibacter psychrophenolicus]MBP2372913.1 glycerate kinase [Paeniglutamicibacter psychrophenolicus]
MKVLIAPDSFKGTFTAAEVAAAIAGGVRSTGASAVELPVADGGEGTEEILGAALGAERILADTMGPWRDPMQAAYSLGADGTAYINLAAASGITLPAPGGRDALTADTYGTGLLMVDAVNRGARHLVVAAGGSATTDGGAGACAAITEHGGLRGAQVVVLSDVTTAFEDAAVVFGPQKGASDDEVSLLTARLHELASTLPRDPRGVPATGAAGGFSGGLWACFGAELVSGADFVLDALDFEAAVAKADAVVVGEGRLDSQTLQGKIISVIMARSRRTPVYAVVGSVSEDAPRDAFTQVLVATDKMHMQAAGAQIARELLGAWSPVQR